MIEQLLKNGHLTREQYDAVVDDTNEILCLACAGSGKSRTLAFRIARLIYQGDEPQSIIAFTFTEKAAESIKRRVSDALEHFGLPVEMVGAMYIGTIHSFCQNLLGQMDAKYRQFEVLDENRLKLFLLSRYSNLGLRDIQTQRNSRMFATISEISSAWKIANDELLDYDEIENEDNLLGTVIKNIYNRLNRDQYIDFSLMIRLVVEALNVNREDVNRALSDIKHLFVDEYQDVNPAQEVLISQIYRRIQTLFVVGDDDQAIYGWRGADVQNILEFDQRYPNCSVHTLSTNFRSTEAIVNVSNRFIQLELGPNRMDKNPVSHSNGNIHHFGNLWFNTREEEANWVAQRINDLFGTRYVEENGEERGLTKSDFVIEMRSVQGGGRNGQPYHRAFTDALSALNIDYIIEAEGSIFERPHSFVLREAMNLLRNPGPSRNEVTDFFQQWVIPHFPNADINEFRNVISTWNNNIHRPPGGARRKVYPQKLVHDLLESFNISSTHFENHEQVLRDLGVFSGIILDIEKVFISIDSSHRYRTILNFLQNVAETGYDTTQVELRSRPDAVTVSTVHKMKGLESPVVFVVDVIQQRFPSRRHNYNGWLPTNLIQNALNRGLYQTNIQAEARLFYTAITRAERFLYITGSAEQPGLQRLKQPSPFKLRIQEIENPEVVTDENNIPEINRIPQRPRIDDESMPTSFTEIKDYLECPMKYKYRKLYGFSPAVPELFGFGLTTHTAINKVHQEFLNNPPTREEAENITEDIFHLKHIFPSNNPENEGPFERARNAAKRIVGDYAQDYPEDFTQSRSLEQRFEIKSGQALITGSIDLLLKEDNDGNILDAKVIDFKSMDYPEHLRTPFFWINLSLQVQLYAHAAEVVLDENAKTGSVHLLKEPNQNDSPNRIEVPIDDNALGSAITNISWAVNRILEADFPMRPSRDKCFECDFKQICSKEMENFRTDIVPPPIHIPEINGVNEIHVRCFSDLNE